MAQSILPKEVVARFHLLSDNLNGTIGIMPAEAEGEPVAVLCWLDGDTPRPLGLILTDAQIEGLVFVNAQLTKEG